MRNTRSRPETRSGDFTYAGRRFTPVFGRLTRATMLGLVAALAAPADSFAVTDDTEVFVNPYITTPDKPNILFIVDNSGSMDNCLDGGGTADDGDCDVEDTRMGAIKQAMYAILTDDNIMGSVNAGLMLFEGQAERSVQSIYYPIAPLNADASTIDSGPTTLPAGVTLSAPETTPTVRTRLLNIIGDMQPRDGTPIVGALLEAGRYLRGDAVGLTSAYFLKTVGGVEKNKFGVSHQSAITGGTVARCTATNAAAQCTASVTPCTSATTDTNAWCSIITGSAVYKSPLTADRGEPYIMPGSPGAPEGTEAPKCRTTDHIILLTDGEPTLFRYAPNNPHSPYAPLENAARTFTGATSCATAPTIGDFIGEGNCGKEIAAYLHSPPNNDFRPGQGVNGPTGSSNQWVMTHTIAFALDSEAGRTYLNEISSAGGGLAKIADTAQQLNDAIREIVGGTLPPANAGFAAPRFSTQAFNRLYSGDDVYVSLFIPSERSRWKGNVKKYRACTDLHPNWVSTTKTCNTTNGNFQFGTILDKNNNTLVDPTTGQIRASASDLWSTNTNTTNGDGADVEKGGAGARLLTTVNTNPLTRNIYTFTGTYDTTTATATPGKVTTHVRSSIDDAAVTAAMFGVADKAPVVAWIRNHGPDVNDEDGDGIKSETIWPFDDPMHSSAVPIEFGTAANTTLKKIFVAGNGGGLRMLNADTGAEEWMFIPQELLPLQVALQTNPAFQLPLNQRLYGIDGTPTVWARDQDGDGIVTDTGDFVRLILGQRDGGNRYFAVDVTPSGATPSINPELKWKIDPAIDPNYADLANSWSRPTFGRLLISGVLKDVLIIGGGNDTTLNDKIGPQLSGARKGNAVFIVDAETGERLALIGGNGTVTTTDPVTGTSTTTQTSNITGFDFPIPGNITAFDSNGDGLTDRLYYGDVGGNVWRSDLIVTTGIAVETRKIADLAADNTLTPAALIQLQNEDTAAVPPITASATTDFRSFYFAPEVVRLDNPRFGGRFDMVIIGSGHSAHPLDVTVHNAMYAIKDKNVNPYTASTTVTPVAGRCASALDASSTDTNCLADLSANTLQRDSTGTYTNSASATTAMENTLKFGAGWVIDMADKGATAGTFVWRGEKAYSQPVVIGGKLFYTTYIPPTIQQMRDASLPGQCGIADGVGRIFARDLLTGAAVFAQWNNKDTTKNPDNSAALTDKDTFRENGGLPPSEIGLGVRPDDIIVAAQSPLEGSPAGTGLPRKRIYWQER